MRFFKSVVIVALAVVFLLSSCSGGKVLGKGSVTVGSKIDTEGALLGSMIVLLLEDNDFTVKNSVQLGPTNIVRKAIINGEIDIYPEYTGNGGFFYPDAPQDVWKDRKKAYETVKRLDYETNKIVWLEPAPANNTWAIAVRSDLAGGNLVSLDDLAEYINAGGVFKIAGSEEFVSRPDALPAFEKAYGFKLSKEQLLILSGGDTATTEKAAANGTDGVNAAMAYGTDGQLAALGLVVLEDNRGVQPVYEPAPIIREDVLKKYPEIKDILAHVFKSLDLVTLQSLNSQISVEGKSPSDVAKKYLKEKGFLKGEK
ncbi:ABC transporter substrate-binding protein [Spirochaetia bacterium 38H-sp]|uniref:ABC transporter substrate-binding protein n=1 Tax=Rarispira pelagica TaxID=3141764 RepID=A0ABU9UC29_9SPIR